MTIPDKLTLEEQIACMDACDESHTPVGTAILASLKELQAIKAAPTVADTVQVPEPDWLELGAKAQSIVQGKSLWRKFIDGTPLSNDIAVWMVDFAVGVNRQVLDALLAQVAAAEADAGMYRQIRDRYAPVYFSRNDGDSPTWDELDAIIRNTSTVDIAIRAWRAEARVKALEDVVRALQPFATEYEIAEESGELQHWPESEVARCKAAFDALAKLDKP